MSSVRGDSAGEVGFLFLELLIYYFLSSGYFKFNTISANKATVNKEWVIVDAEGQTLGRLCAKGSEAFAW